ARVFPLLPIIDSKLSNRAKKLTTTSPIAGKERESALMALTILLSVLQRAYRASAARRVAHVGVSQAMACPLVVVGRHGSGVGQRGRDVGVARSTCLRFRAFRARKSSSLSRASPRRCLRCTARAAPDCRGRSGR